MSVSVEYLERYLRKVAKDDLVLFSHLVRFTEYNHVPMTKLLKQQEKMAAAHNWPFLLKRKDYNIKGYDGYISHRQLEHWLATAISGNVVLLRNAWKRAFGREPQKQSRDR